MNRTVLNRILDIYDTAKEDAVYNSLYKEYAQINPRLLNLLFEISPQQQEVIMDFIGITCQMQFRLMELACSRYKK